MSQSMQKVLERFQRDLEEGRNRFRKSIEQILEAQEKRSAESMEPILKAQEIRFAESMEPFLEAQEKRVKELTDPILKAQEKRVKELMDPMLKAQEKRVKDLTSPILKAQETGLVYSMKPFLEAFDKRIDEATRWHESDILPKDEAAAFDKTERVPKVEIALAAIGQTMVSDLSRISERNVLDMWRATYLGRHSPVNNVIAAIGSIPTEERADFGQGVNLLRTIVDDAFKQQELLVNEQVLARDLEEGEIDITLPAHPRKMGGLHPSTRTHREFQAIWADMGFQVYQSFDVEEDELNFTLLNLPPHHPARDMQDTFYTTNPKVLLRTHTSPGQIRAMRELGDGGSKPIRVILPGMCYRQEQVTARSEIQFTQVEGLAIGRNIRMSDLKGTITEFAKRMYNPHARVRYRASYFPFTEPSMEVDVECFLCDGEGCRVCKYTGWLEIAGSGMVHPTVLRNGGYDPSEWSGFAFGMGPERITMLKHGIQDIRYFWGNDLRFLQQF